MAAESWLEALADYARVLRREYLLHRDGARTFSGTRLTDAGVLRDQEPWMRQWVTSGLSVSDLTAAAELITAFVVGFVIEEEERSASAGTDPDRHAVEHRDSALRRARA